MNALKFSILIPDTDEPITADWTTAGHAQVLKAQPGLCGELAHDCEYIACLTQWGFDSQRDIVVMRCKRCERQWAFKLSWWGDEILPPPQEHELKVREAV